MDGKQLGKIKEIDVITEYGHVFLQIEFTGEGFGVFSTMPLQPSPKVKDPENWSIFQLAPIMEAAKVTKLSLLKNKPVEVIFEHGILKDWRILTEVL